MRITVTVEAETLHEALRGLGMLPGGVEVKAVEPDANVLSIAVDRAIDAATAPAAPAAPAKGKGGRPRKTTVAAAPAEEAPVAQAPALFTNPTPAAAPDAPIPTEDELRLALRSFCLRHGIEAGFAVLKGAGYELVSAVPSADRPRVMAAILAADKGE